MKPRNGSPRRFDELIVKQNDDGAWELRKANWHHTGQAFESKADAVHHAQEMASNVEVHDD